MIPGGQMTILCGIITWIYFSSLFNLTQKLRSFIQPWVSKRVRSETRIIFEIQVLETLHVLLLFLVSCYLLILAWFLVWFAEAPTWGFGCFVFRLVLCCFRAFLHCFSSLAFLGIISFFSWFDFELFCWLITSMHSWIWLWGFYVVERAWQIG